MSQESPATTFLNALDAHIEARTATATLQFQRLHARQREAAQAQAIAACKDTKADLETAINDLFKETRRFGI